jgi:hypothetical protein
MGPGNASPENPRRAATLLGSGNLPFKPMEDVLRRTELHSSGSSVPVLRSIAITARKKALIR